MRFKVCLHSSTWQRRRKKTTTEGHGPDFSQKQCACHKPPLRLRTVISFEHESRNWPVFKGKWLRLLYLLRKVSHALPVVWVDDLRYLQYLSTVFAALSLWDYSIHVWKRGFVFLFVYALFYKKVSYAPSTRLSLNFHQILVLKLS